MIAGLAVVLATLAGSQQLGPPAADPQLTAVLSQPPRSSLVGDLGRLAADGVPGADALHRGFVALLAGEQGPGWAQACSIWESAAATSAEAAHFTAECFEHGNDRPADAARAAELYSLAGEGGFPKSLCALGNLHMAGRGVPRDPARAAELCRRGAEMGDVDAQTDLGDFYLRGEGVPRDFVEARRWYERAAERGQKNALFTLGAMAWNGDGGERDLEAAGRWFEAAYEAGRRDAAALAGRAALIRAVPNAPSGPVDADLLAAARHWTAIAVEMDPSEEGRARAAVALAQISGYEALVRQQAGDE